MVFADVLYKGRCWPRPSVMKSRQHLQDGLLLHLISLQHWESQPISAHGPTFVGLLWSLLISILFETNLTIQSYLFFWCCFSLDWETTSFTYSNHEHCFRPLAFCLYFSALVKFSFSFTFSLFQQRLTKVLSEFCCSSQMARGRELTIAAEQIQNIVPLLFERSN